MVGLVVLSIAAVKAAAMDLIWRPRADEAHAYRLALRIQYDIGAVSYHAKVRHRVVKVEPDGTYALESLVTEAAIVAGDVDQHPAAAAPTVERFDRRGKSLRAVPTTADPFEVMTRFYPPLRPVELGGKWTHDVPVEVGAPPTRITFELVRRDAKTNSLLVAVRYAGTVADRPFAADGRFDLDEKTFALIRYSGTVVNYRPDADSPEGIATLSLERDKT